MQHLKIFNVETIGEAIIVTPRGEGSSFRYQDLHLEANVIRAQVSKPGVRQLLIDLNSMEYFGSEFIGALVSMLREIKTRRGTGNFCCANPQMLQVLSNMSLLRLWPHFETREEALSSVTATKS
ncbi:STAS domain-containing protein [Planctomicrobium sp. SH527]|uniref:STAS domain-containing protein n=1 Tax=Planctomicrobium sp. SH527 TaxID=3448123 RepID=UPI003F5B507E